MYELIKAIGHINFYLADTDEIQVVCEVSELLRSFRNSSGTVVI